VISELARVAKGILYFQAFVRGQDYYFLRFKKAISLLMGLNAVDAREIRSKWGHIKSYSHTEGFLLDSFKAARLEVEAIDRLSTYGALRVNCYVVRKR